MRPIESADLAAIMALNNANEREVGLVDKKEFARLVSVAVHARVIGAADAFLLAFDHEVPSQGPNHSWFLARHPRFFYVDRVCVAAHARKRGLARALYADAFAVAGARDLQIICCEVNIDPPNPVSDAFHAALGFSEVGRAFIPARKKTVRYLERKTI